MVCGERLTEELIGFQSLKTCHRFQSRTYPSTLLTPPRTPSLPLSEVLPIMLGSLEHLSEYSSLPMEATPGPVHEAIFRNYGQDILNAFKVGPRYVMCAIDTLRGPFEYTGKILVSNDSGATWSAVGPPGGCIRIIYLKEITTFLAITYSSSATACIIQMSVDDGATWNEVPGFRNLNTTGFPVISASVEGPGAIYVLVGNPGDQELYVGSPISFGCTFVKVATVNVAPTTQYYNNLVVYAHPLNSSMVFLGKWFNAYEWMESM